MVVYFINMFVLQHINASNMIVQYNRLITLIKNKIKNIKSIFFVSIYCFSHHHNLSVKELYKTNIITIFIKISK